MHTFFAQSVPATLNTVVPVVQPPPQERHFYAKLPASKVFTIQRDPLLGIWYRPNNSGFGMDVGFLSEDNLRFIKVLHRHHQLESAPGQLTRSHIKAIVKDCDYDSDLWDDIYRNDDVFRSVYSEDDIRKEKPQATLPQIHRAKMKKSVDFYMDDSQKDEFRSDADYRKFVRSRINVFKFYIYLRRCAILYRESSFKAPLNNLLYFLSLPKQPGEKKSNYEWLKDELRVKAVGRHDENWNTGLHEWLTCDQTLEALMRTAGMRRGAGIESHLSETIWGYREVDATESEYFCSEFNWLDLQLLLRTPDKYVIFRSRIDTIENGHCGAVNNFEHPRDARYDKCIGATLHAPSEEAFHGELNELLRHSGTIQDFVVQIHQKYNISIFHDGTPIRPSLQRKFLVDGTPTDNLPRLEVFKGKLVDPHRFFYHCERDIGTHERIVHEKEQLKRIEQSQQRRLAM